MDADTLDVCKENIQPLRKGRVAAQLGVALQAQTDVEVQKQLLKQRESYEVLIRMYDGPDPLQPRYDYVAWIEQAYPKHGPESNLVPLLEDTIMTFKDDDRYKQDPRFVELIVKYIETQGSALELYQMVYSQGLGTMCALLYKSWAEELDRNMDVKRANQIFQLGISNRAQPLDMLKQAHLMFQLSVGRRMLCGEDLNKEEAEMDGSRQALTKLKKAGPVRKPHGLPGIVPLTSSTTSNSKKNNAPIAVYQEDENGEPLLAPLTQNMLGGFVHSEKMHKENTMKAGTWNKPYNKRQFNHLPQPLLPSTPSFKVHVDIEPEEETPSRPIADVPNALRPKRADTFTCPMAIFEPPDPTVKPMYCKNKVYAGGSEFSLEEIRAAVYLKKYEEQKKIEELKELGLYQPEFETTKSVFHPPPPTQPVTPVASRLPYQGEECRTILKGTESLRLCDTLPRTKIITHFPSESDTPSIEDQEHPSSAPKLTGKINKKLHFEGGSEDAPALQPKLLTLYEDDEPLPLPLDTPQEQQFSIFCDEGTKPLEQPKPTSKIDIFVDDSPPKSGQVSLPIVPIKAPSSFSIFSDDDTTNKTAPVVTHKDTTKPATTVFRDDDGGGNTAPAPSMPLKKPAKAPSKFSVFTEEDAPSLLTHKRPSKPSSMAIYTDDDASSNTKTTFSSSMPHKKPSKATSLSIYTDEDAPSLLTHKKTPKPSSMNIYADDAGQRPTTKAPLVSHKTSSKPPSMGVFMDEGVPSVKSAKEPQPSAPRKKPSSGLSSKNKGFSIFTD